MNDFLVIAFFCLGAGLALFWVIYNVREAAGEHGWIATCAVLAGLVLAFGARALFA